jgi:hypothetical protein
MAFSVATSSRGGCRSCTTTPTSPIGLTFAAVRLGGRTKAVDPVAVIGLGTGSLAAYGRKGEEFTFFEIDPQVVHVARSQFTYLQDSPASCRVVVGDARLSMREPDHKYGLIVLDAFSSDAIPTHLLTCEAIALYRDKLTAHGIIAIHVTNKYLNLETVVFAVARANGLVAQSWFDETTSAAAKARAKSVTQWVIRARQPADFRGLMHSPGWRAVCRDQVRAWTDDYSNLFGVLNPGALTLK